MIFIGISRKARIDIPGLLQHVMVHGIKRSDIFMVDKDRDWFVRRFPSPLEGTGTDCFAWALLCNHFTGFLVVIDPSFSIHELPFNRLCNHF